MRLRLGYWKQSEDLLGVLLKGKTLQFIGGNLDGIGHLVGIQPLAGGEDLGGAEAGSEEITHYFMTLGDKEVLGLAELFLLQLAHIFNLIFANHFSKFALILLQKYTIFPTDYTVFTENY